MSNMHDIEWVDSLDYSEGDECKAIREVGEHLRTFPMPDRAGGK